MLERKDRTFFASLPFGEGNWNSFHLSPATVSQIFKISWSLAGPQMNVCIQMGPSVTPRLPSWHLHAVPQGWSLEERREPMWPERGLFQHFPPRSQLYMTGSCHPILIFPSHVSSSHFSPCTVSGTGLRRSLFCGMHASPHRSNNDNDSIIEYLLCSQDMSPSKKSHGGEGTPLRVCPERTALFRLIRDWVTFVHSVYIC